MNYKNIVDFTVEISEKRDYRILQITDMQPVDPSQQRYPGRLGKTPVQEFTSEMKYDGMYYYMDEAVKRTNPDLILVTGDIVYGEFDDNGSNLLEITDRLDSYKIPWAPVFGNHDNESKKGVTWQCEVFGSHKYCLFKRRDLTGNGNYNIGLVRNGRLIYVIYMLDSNGCYNAKSYNYQENYPLYNQDEKVEVNGGIYPDQIKWIDESSMEIDKAIGHLVPKMAAFHIPPDAISKQAYKNGYQKDALFDNFECYTIGKEVEAKNNDFGTKGERFAIIESLELWNILKKNNFKHVFVGHNHTNDVSILSDGIRVTFGLKTGIFDYHKNLGGTLILIDENENVAIEHKYIKEKE